jgi:3-isopropylmalate dehydrogenase
VLRSLFFFRQIFLEVAASYPDIAAECLYVDAAAQALVLQPSHFDVIVTENLFGDVLSDLGGATVGGIALCPSGNIGEHCAYFEPIHGSAPALAGTNQANPIGQILSLSMLLAHIGEADAAAAVRESVTSALTSGELVVESSGAIAGGAAAATARLVASLAL